MLVWSQPDKPGRDMDNHEQNLRRDIESLRADVKWDIERLRADVKKDWAETKAELIRGSSALAFCKRR